MGEGEPRGKGAWWGCREQALQSVEGAKVGRVETGRHIPWDAAWDSMAPPHAKGVGPGLRHCPQTQTQLQANRHGNPWKPHAAPCRATQAKVKGSAAVPIGGGKSAVFDEAAVLRVLARRPDRVSSKLLKKEYKLSKKIDKGGGGLGGLF